MDRPLGPRSQPPERHAAYEDIFGRRPQTHAPPPHAQRPPQQYHQQQQVYPQQQQQYHPQYQQYAPAPPPAYGYPARGGYQQYGGSTPSLRAPSVRSMAMHPPPPGAGPVYAPHASQSHLPPPQAQYAHGQHGQYAHTPAPPPAAYPPAADAQGLTPAQAYQAQVAARAPPSLSLSVDIGEERLGIDFEGEGGWGAPRSANGNGNGNGVNGMNGGGVIVEGEEGAEDGDDDEESELPWARGEFVRSVFPSFHGARASIHHRRQFAHASLVFLYPGTADVPASIVPHPMISVPHLARLRLLRSRPRPRPLPSISAAGRFGGGIRGPAGGLAPLGASTTIRLFATTTVRRAFPGTHSTCRGRQILSYCIPSLRLSSFLSSSFVFLIINLDDVLTTTRSFLNSRTTT
ncbi:hypothetical protein B0H16DRAFT_1895991 [Mycena metata]|uniref:Uncharacterized protein n=1 Tax=Mycena metata TaxID=1033252 RepID=A0AAD7HKS1_9AGAR|nr:hypothetical protein B0H16DRAFT_1895991 [Mycena metata]